MRSGGRGLLPARAAERDCSPPEQARRGQSCYHKLECLRREARTTKSNPKNSDERQPNKGRSDEVLYRELAQVRGFTRSEAYAVGNNLAIGVPSLILMERPMLVVISSS
jgi:hypothetical protein